MKREDGSRKTDGTEVVVVNLHQVEQNDRAHRTDGRYKRMLGFALGIALVGLAAGCHKTPAQDPATAQMNQDPGDPADANMAPVNGSQPAQVLGQNDQYQPQQQGEDYTQQQAAPIVRQAPDGQTYSAQSDPNYSAQNNDQGNDNGQYDTQQAEDAYAADLADAEASDPPPPLPVYEQPPAPDPNYLWTPGYWAWGGGGYYWVPGCWVAAPYTGALWTPGYWGYVGNRYRFHRGFWGLHIGFYGGINYGYGYTGYGYHGGYWNSGRFYYNTSVNRINVTRIHNVYQRTVVIDHRTFDGGSVNRVSFNGGRGGIQVQPRAAEVAVMQEQRHAPMASQIQVQHAASQNRAQFYSQNKGRPAVAVNARPVVADRTPPAALPRVAVPAMRPAGPMNRPGNQMQGGNRGVQQGQPQSQMRPALPQAQEHNAQPANGPGTPQQQGTRPGQPQQGWQQQRQQQENNATPQTAQPQQGWQQQQRQRQENNATPQTAQPQQGWQQQQRQQQENKATPQTAQPQSQFRPGLQQTQPQQRGPQPETRQPQPNLQSRPQPETRPAAPIQQRPQEQMRPQQQEQRPQEQMRPQQQPQPRPQEQPRPQQQPQQRPQEQPRPQQQAPQQRSQHVDGPPRPQQQAHVEPQSHPSQPRGDEKDHH